jgi:pimeloyl-ACP methyl ester carboxylesterase
MINQTIKVMKLNFLTLAVLLLSSTLQAQSTTKMEKKFINTEIGRIALFYKQINTEKIPVLFLHGVYFDHHLWEYQIEQITERTVIAIDMPMHGESNQNIKVDWNLNNCADMLLEILDSLKIDKVIAVGHSWGSMTILRAANKSPQRFSASVLCNMPFKEISNKEKRNIRLQHSALFFRKFYMKQAGKALMGKESLVSNPDLLQKLLTPMSRLSSKEIKYIDKAVRINADDATHLIENLKTPSIAIVGEEDYVGIPLVKETITVKGGHISPLEVPEEVNMLISKLIKLAD